MNWELLWWFWNLTAGDVIKAEEFDSAVWNCLDSEWKSTFNIFDAPIPPKDEESPRFAASGDPHKRLLKEGRPSWITQLKYTEDDAHGDAAGLSPTFRSFFAPGLSDELLDGAQVIREIVNASGNSNGGFELTPSQIEEIIKRSLSAALSPLKEILADETRNSTQNDPRNVTDRLLHSKLPPHKNRRSPSHAVAAAVGHLMSRQLLEVFGEGEGAGEAGGQGGEGQGALWNLIAAEGALLERQNRLVKELTVFIPPTSDFLEETLSMLPVFNAMLPIVQAVMYRVLSALVELTPRRINLVTLLPAIVEIISALVASQESFQAFLPAANFFLGELELWLRASQGFLPVFMDELPSILRQNLTSVQMPRYSEAMKYTGQIMTASLPVLKSFETFLPAYIAFSPSLRGVLGLASLMSQDVSDSLHVTLVRLEKEAPRILTMYSGPTEVLPILAANFVSTIRRTRIPSRIPNIKAFKEPISVFVPAMRTLLASLQVELPSVLDKVLPLAINLPRESNLTASLSHLLIQSHNVGNLCVSSIIPSVISLIDSIEPIVTMFRSSQMSLSLLLRTFTHTFRESLNTLPRLLPFLPTLSPLFVSLYRFLDIAQPALLPLNQLLLSFQTHGASIRQLAGEARSFLPHLRKLLVPSDF